MPLDINKFMKQCTEEVGQEVISATAQGVDVQRNTPPAWVTTAHIKHWTWCVIQVHPLYPNY